MEQTTGLTAPKVTIEQVLAAIISETYSVLPNGRTTVCQLTLDNGFTVEGSSACVSIENFDPAKGRQFSRERAIEKVWQMLGFRLADQIHAVKSLSVERYDAPEVVAEPGPTKPVKLGDQMHYYEQSADKTTPPMHALVSAVLDHEYVALTVFAPNGTPHPRAKVRVVYPWSDVPADQYYVRPKN